MKQLLLILLLLPILADGQISTAKNDYCKCHLGIIKDSIATKEQVLENMQLVCDNKECVVVSYNISFLFPKDYLGPYKSNRALPAFVLKRIKEAHTNFNIVIEDIQIEGVHGKQGSIIIKVKVN